MTNAVLIAVKIRAIRTTVNVVLKKVIKLPNVKINKDIRNKRFRSTLAVKDSRTGAEIA